MEFSMDYNPHGFPSALREIRHYLKKQPFWNSQIKFSDIPSSSFWWEDEEDDNYTFYTQQDEDLDFDWELDD